MPIKTPRQFFTQLHTSMSTLGITVHKARSPSFKPPRQPGAAPRLRLLAATHNARGKKTAYDLSPELTTPYAILDVTSQTPTTCRDRVFSPLLGKHWAEAAWQSCKVYDGVDRAKDAAWWAAVVAARKQPKCPRRSALVTAYKKRYGKYPREVRWTCTASRAAARATCEFCGNALPGCSSSTLTRRRVVGFTTNPRPAQRFIREFIANRLAFV